jgi:putative ABC transport system ATP-binding protein
VFVWDGSSTRPRNGRVIDPPHTISMHLPIPPHPDVPLLRTEHLGRQINGKTIVEDISIEVLRGELLAIVGPSGAGKSSFLRLLNRLDEPTSGTFYLEGTDMRQIPPRDLRRRIGTVMQTAHLFPGTVAENLRFGPRQQNRDLSAERIRQLLRQVRLEGYEEQSASTLSGGEAQRVSLARALANEPCVLLMDEPTSALHDAVKLEVETLISDVVHATALTCLIVTHDTAQAARMANRVLAMRDGKLIRIGPTQEVLHAISNFP